MKFFTLFLIFFGTKPAQKVIFSRIFSLSPKFVTCIRCPLTPQLCRFTTPLPHLAIYTGLSDLPCASPSLSFAASAPVCPSPISVALDSTSTSERRAEACDGEAGRDASAPGPVSRSRVALSLRRLLRRGCPPSTTFASLSPTCQATAGTSGRVQPVRLDQPSQAPPRRITR